MKEDLSLLIDRPLSFSSDTGQRKNKQHLNNSRAVDAKVCVIF
jgi:hypothetical protein